MCLFGHRWISRLWGELRIEFIGLFLNGDVRRSTIGRIIVTKEEYREIRKRLGSQETAAKLLGVALNTVSRRETGRLAISDEAQLAITHLAHCLYVRGRRRSNTQ